jgi:hypothetical protein
MAGGLNSFFVKRPRCAMSWSFVQLVTTASASSGELTRKLMREFAEHISPAFHSVGVDLPRDGAAMAVAALHLEAIQPAVTHPPLRVGESFGLGR